MHDLFLGYASVCNRVLREWGAMLGTGINALLPKKIVISLLGKNLQFQLLLAHQNGSDAASDYYLYIILAMKNSTSTSLIYHEEIKTVIHF